MAPKISFSFLFSWQFSFPFQSWFYQWWQVISAPLLRHFYAIFAPVSMIFPSPFFAHLVRSFWLCVWIINLEYYIYFSFPCAYWGKSLAHILTSVLFSLSFLMAFFQFLLPPTYARIYQTDIHGLIQIFSSVNGTSNGYPSSHSPFITTWHSLSSFYCTFTAFIITWA